MVIAPNVLIYGYTVVADAQLTHSHLQPMYSRQMKGAGIKEEYEVLVEPVGNGEFEMEGTHSLFSCAHFTRRREGA